MPTSPSGFSGSSSTPGIQFDSNDGTAHTWSSSDRSAATFLQNTEFALLTFGTRAETLGDRQEVRALARELRRHYEGALDELQQVSGDQLPRITSLNATNQQYDTQLASATGSAFDRLFIQYVVQIIATNMDRMRSQNLSSSSALGQLVSSEMQSESALLRAARELAPMVGAPSR